MALRPVARRFTGLPAVPAPGLVLGSVISVQVGAALAKHVIADLGPAAAVTLRLVFAAALLVALWRPRIRREHAGLLLAYGLSLGTMNLLFYEALGRAPLGVCVTVEFLGPLAVAVAGSRRLRDGAVVALAALGIGLLARGGGHVSTSGLVLAALAGACWAAYILVSSAVGRRMDGTGPLAVAMVAAAVVVLPFGGGDMLRADGHTVLLGLAVGVLSSVLPYALELEALRRLSTRTFGVLMSLEPAVAALAGLLILGERLAGRQWAGIGCVILACAAVTASQRRSATVQPTNSVGYPSQAPPSRLSAVKIGRR
jgi:inner membrane transporter RhtA